MAAQEPLVMHPYWWPGEPEPREGLGVWRGRENNRVKRVKRVKKKKGFPPQSR